MILLFMPLDIHFIMVFVPCEVDKISVFIPHLVVMLGCERMMFLPI